MYFSSTPAKKSKSTNEDPIASTSTNINRSLINDKEGLNKKLGRLNKAFVKKCANSTDKKKGGDPNSSLVPIALDYVSNTLKLILNHEEEFPADNNKLHSFLEDIESSVAQLSSDMKSFRNKHSKLNNVSISTLPSTTMINFNSGSNIGPGRDTQQGKNESTKPVDNFTFGFPAQQSKMDPTKASGNSMFGITQPNEQPKLPPSFSFGITQQPKDQPKAPENSSFFKNAESSPGVSTTTSLTTPGFGAFQNKYGALNGVSNPATFAKPNNGNNDDDDDEDAEPPKNEFTPVQEENVVHQTRVKVFEKQNNNFKDLGLGTLYVKKLEDKKKHHLFVRAENNLGTVLVNILLSKGVPISTMKKNVKTFDPVTKKIFLIRVKTEEDAEQLKTKLEEFRES